VWDSLNKKKGLAGLVKAFQICFFFFFVKQKTKVWKD
jgi:hypothetical protein